MDKGFVHLARNPQSSCTHGSADQQPFVVEVFFWMAFSGMELKAMSLSKSFMTLPFLPDQHLATRELSYTGQDHKTIFTRVKKSLIFFMGAGLFNGCTMVLILVSGFLFHHV